MAFKVNKTKTDLGSYPPFMLLAQRGFGKTTFFRDLTKYVYGDLSKGLLISCGLENGYKSLHNVVYAEAQVLNEDYEEDKLIGDGRGFIQIIDDIVDNNSEYGFKIVFIDTLDTLIDIAEPEILRLHRKEMPDKPIAKSYNSALNGYQEGHKRAVNIIREQVNRLTNIGIAVFYLAHTKLKTKKDLFTKEEYEQFTNNLLPVFFGGIADNCQIVMVGNIEKEIADKQIEEEKRVVYLRPTFLVDGKSRFTYLPEKIDFSPEAFMEAFENAVKAEWEASGETVDLNKIKNAEIKERNKIAKEAVSKDQNNRAKETELEEDLENREKYIEIITSKFGKAEDDIKKQAKKLLVDNGCKKFTDAELPIEVLGEIAGLF